MATEVTHNAAMQLPQLQSVQKAMAIPTVGAAVGQFGALYSRVKGAHSLLEWALSTAEASMTMAATVAAPYVAVPLAAGDARVSAALDELERRVPLVAEEPKVIVETTKQAVMTRLSPHVNKVQSTINTTLPQVCGAKVAAEQRVKSLKDLSWAKANALLSTAYGQKALQGVDNGASYAMQLLDHYLPPLEQEEPSKEIVAATSDPAMHTMQTVGRLSSVAARRVWANLAVKINELRKAGIELDVRRYIAALLAALHLAKVTSQQQQQEQQQQQQQQETVQPAEPAPSVEPAAQPQATAPTTAAKVKTTPEPKSTVTEKPKKEKVNSSQ